MTWEDAEEIIRLHVLSMGMSYGIRVAGGDHDIEFIRWRVHRADEEWEVWTWYAGDARHCMELFSLERGQTPDDGWIRRAKACVQMMSRGGADKLMSGGSVAYKEPDKPD